MKIYISAANSAGKGDFTVIQNIYSDSDEYMLNAFVKPVYLQEYDVNLADVQRTFPNEMKLALKGWDSNTFNDGDDITDTPAARYIKNMIGDEQMYADYLAYVKQHAEFIDPCRDVTVVINNTACLPSADERIHEQTEELGRYLGRVLLPRR